MKHRFYTRAVSLFLVFGLLLTGLVLPAFAVPASDTNISSNTPVANDELLVADEIDSQADAPVITGDGKIFEYIDGDEEQAFAVADVSPGTDSSITFGFASTSVVVGGPLTLTVITNPSGQTITWSSSDPSVAFIRPNGTVLARKAGSTTITASFVDTNGVTHSTTCTLYVRIADGVYYIQNTLSEYYLQSEGKITGLPNVHQYSKYAATANIIDRLPQMWKIRYLSQGRYSIRPMHKLNMALDVTNSNVDICNVGTSDGIANIPTCALWTLTEDANGYIFKNNGLDDCVLQVANASIALGANVIVGADSATNTSSRWDLEIVSNPPVGTLLYDTATESIATNEVRYIVPGQTRSLSELGFVPAFYSGTSILQDFYWYSSDTTKATVNSSTGAVTSVSAGTVVITARKNYNGTYYYVSYTLVVTGIPEGTYFLKNKQTGYYADIKNQTMAVGTTIQQWEFNGGGSQRWIFTLLDDGYYTIKSNNSSGAYYMGVINDSSGLDVDIVLRAGAVTDGMKWKIELTANGAYKVIPKTGEANGYVLATSTSSASNGYKLIQGDYLDNSSYRDEWLLDPYSAVFYGVTNAGHDHISSLSAISNTMINENWNEVTVRSGVIPSSVCKADLLSTTVFTSRSHGQLITYSTTGNTASTGIILNDADENANYIAFYSHSWSSMSSGSTYIYSNEDYTGLVLALFIGCSTASGGENGRNLPATIVKHGAIAAVGFSESIGCIAANTWTRYFYQKMLQGATLEEAVNFACSNVPETSGLHSVVICGDSTLKLPIS